MRINHNVGRNSMLFYLSDPVVARINMRRTTRRTMADHGRHHRVHQPKVQAYLRDDHPLYIALITQLRPLITEHISATEQSEKTQFPHLTLQVIPQPLETAILDIPPLDQGLVQP